MCQNILKGEKKMKKWIIVIVILIIVICGGLFIYNISNDDNSQPNTNTNSNTISNETSNTNNEVLDNNNDISNNISSNATENENNNANTDNHFRVREVSNEEFNASYEVTETEEDTVKNALTIAEQDDDLTITFKESDLNEMLFGRGKAIEYNEKYVIRNVTSDEVETIFYGMEGQDWDYPLVFLLLKDGTVKGIAMENGYKTGEFVAEDISEVNNVDRFEQVSVTPQNNSGYNAVVAVTKDGSIYEIGASM